MEIWMDVYLFHDGDDPDIHPPPLPFESWPVISSCRTQRMTLMIFLILDFGRLSSYDASHDASSYFGVKRISRCEMM